MATAGSQLSDVDDLRQNQLLLEKVCRDFEKAARQLDNSKNTIRIARGASGVCTAATNVASALGPVGTLAMIGFDTFVPGRAAALLAVTALAVILQKLSEIVVIILDNDDLHGLENNWSEVKERYTSDFDIPRRNKDAIADWARRTLPDNQARAVIRAIEKYTSDLRSTDRLKKLESRDIRALLESLRLLVAADFSAHEILVAAAKEKDEPGNAVRSVVLDMDKYRTVVEKKIEKKREEKRQREEEEKMRREEEKRRREKEEKRRQKELHKKLRVEIEKKWQEREEKRRREEEEKIWQEVAERITPAGKNIRMVLMENEQEKKQLKDEEKLSGKVGSIKLKIDILPSEDPLKSKAGTPSGDLSASPPSLEHDLPFERSLKDPLQGTPPPSFCDRWDIQKICTNADEIIQKERSEVVLRIPRGAIKPNVFVNVSLAVCADVKTIREDLSLDDCDYVASPMVEVSAEADFLFEERVQITLPHCLPRQVSPDQLIIYRAAGSKGNRVFWKVPPLHYQAADRPSTHADVPWDEDAAYGVTDDRKIVIHTRRFSSYTCIECRKENQGSPLLLIVGSGTNEVADKQTQKAAVDVHIWDRRLSILDFAEQIQNRVTDAEQMTVDLAGVDDDKQFVTLRLDVVGQYSSRWKHTRGADGDPYPKEQEIHLGQVLHCDHRLCTSNHKMMPFVVHWKLETSKPRTKLTALPLQCAVHINFLPRKLTKEFPIELKEPLKTEQLMELPLPELKNKLYCLGLSSGEIWHIAATEGNHDEDHVKRRLIERTIQIREKPLPLPPSLRPPPSPDGLTGQVPHVDVVNRSRASSISSADTLSQSSQQ